MSIFMSIKRCGSIWVWCDLRYHTIRSDMRNTFIVAMISHWVPFRRDRVSHNSICNGTIGQVRQHVLSINIVCQGHPEKKNSDNSILTHVPGIPSDQNIVFSTLYSQLPISSEHKFMSIIARVCNFGVWEEFPFCLVSVITRVRSTKLCWQDLKKCLFYNWTSPLQPPWGQKSWAEVVRWPLLDCSPKKVAIVDRWPLYRGGQQWKFNCSEIYYSLKCL